MTFGIVLALLLLLQAVVGQENQSADTPLTFVTTFCANKTAIPAVHVLTESLIRAGHREGLKVLTSADVSPRELGELQRVPFTTILSAPSSKEYCGSEGSAVDECGLLRISLFARSELPAKRNIIYLAHDSVVLSSLDELRSTVPFSAVRATHSDGFDFDLVVLQQDQAVSEALKTAYCTGKVSATEVFRKVIPVEVWNPLDDSFGVPAEHLDTAWYKQANVSTKIVRFAQSARPWKWWQDTARFSLTAAAHWCQAAARTPYEYGWGRESRSKTVSVARRAPAQPLGTTRVSQFAVLLSTYRRPIWRSIARHFVAMRIVSKVVVVWHDPDADEPSLQGLGPKVTVVRPGTDSLNNRFVTPEGGLPEAVYVCDDDMWVREASLKHVFEVWQENTRRLVGLFPRKWGTDTLKYSARVSNGYNIVLTKGVFIHRAFLFMYERLLPQRVKAVVDEHKNCEDILMNIMMSSYTGLSPMHVVVEEVIVDLGLSDGISRKRAHFLTRVQCVEDIVNALDLVGWQPPMTLGSMAGRPLKNREAK